ncbi:MAG: hypothetical protein UR66_C0002G0037 [Candidatus Moranbacteria bacterium GW2011_GWE1_35_17]|nr:MAG: hypothetical protein UR66_C0002G0037 [Candidatus Moranbacteria bacterium GW2011_GWE1_35_17]KKP84333.1 MAG: hypothetical protein UR82_C0008G0006 [Candidatus Moranbacteria bacterium GW2011_GWF1_35_5]KKP84760.1 MAG: hypothetical protein UR83_C0013G0024 [Candidatus Moranbacteria bacterium GW2011_GWF2_35_54]
MSTSIVWDKNMPRYKIIGNKIQLMDTRFDHYSDEALSFFSKLESLAGSPPPIALTDTQELTEWRNRQWKEFSEAIENCRHKIQAINYSISLIESEIKNPPIPRFKLLMDLEEKEFFDDIVLFEFESFLFQILSFMDVFVHLLKLFYPVLNSKDKYRIGFKGRGVEGRGVAGKGTSDALRGAGEVELADYIDDEVEKWIQVIYDLRNEIVHHSRVRNLQMFLIGKNGLNAPKFSDNGMDLLEYCKNTYENLKIFLNNIDNDFLFSKADSFYEIK